MTFTLKNTGAVAGNEVCCDDAFSGFMLTVPQIPQLYISSPASSNSPPYVLKGFDSIHLSPGQSTLVTLQLSRYDLSIWNVVTQRWEIPSGATKITIGASSRDHRLTGTIQN